MARPRKPTAIKKLQGTLQPCRTNFYEPMPVADLKKVSPPEFLSDKAQGIWFFALEQVPDEMLGTIDYSIFLQWVILHEQIINIQKTLQEEGMMCHNPETGASEPHPLLSTQIKLQQNLVRVCTELGFTPASRSKVQVKKSKSEPDNPFINL